MAIVTDNAILYHIPKTGGTWVKRAMRAAGLDWGYTHTAVGPSPFGLKRSHGTPDNTPDGAKMGRFAIAFVRRPVAWYRSYWAFRSRKGARRDEGFPADGLWSDDFDTFVNNLLDAYPDGFVSTLYRLYVGAHAQKVDYVGRTEHLGDDLARGLALAGESYDDSALRLHPVVNASPDEWKARAVLSAETQARVAECEKWVREMFY